MKVLWKSDHFLLCKNSSQVFWSLQSKPGISPPNSFLRAANRKSDLGVWRPPVGLKKKQNPKPTKPERKNKFCKILESFFKLSTDVATEVRLRWAAILLWRETESISCRESSWKWHFWHAFCYENVFLAWWRVWFLEAMVCKRSFPCHLRHPPAMTPHLLTSTL